MIETLISSQTRIKLLLKFFLNSKTTSYLRGLESEFGDSTNSIRIELNRLEKAGMLKHFTKGNKKYFQANTDHPLFNEVHNIVMKYIGLDRVIANIIERLGHVYAVYLTGDFAKGINSKIIDLVFVGQIDKEFLIKLIEKAEPLVKRKIRYLIYEDQTKFDIAFGEEKDQPFLLWFHEENDDKV